LGLFGISGLPRKEDDREKRQVEQAQKARCHRPPPRRGKRAVFEGEGDGSEWRNARVPSPANVRKTKTGIEGLAASIAAHGLLQYLQVGPEGESFEVLPALGSNQS
jgi:hypothetical protein